MDQLEYLVNLEIHLKQFSKMGNPLQDEIKPFQILLWDRMRYIQEREPTINQIQGGSGRRNPN